MKRSEDVATGIDPTMYFASNLAWRTVADNRHDQKNNNIKNGLDSKGALSRFDEDPRVGNSSRQRRRSCDDESYRHRGNLGILERETEKFVDKTSLQGADFIHNAENLAVRLFWIIIFLAGMGATLWQLSTLFIKYFHYPVATTISLSYENIPFPTVTICNLNAIRKSQAYRSVNMSEFMQKMAGDVQKYVNPEEMKRYLKPRTVQNDSTAFTTENITDGSANGELGSGQNSTDGNGNSTDSSSDDYSYYYDYSDTADTSQNGNADLVNRTPSHLSTMDQAFFSAMSAMDNQMRMEVGHQLNTTVLSCSINGMHCNESDFAVVQDPYYGNCFAFNSDSRKKSPFMTRKPGMQAGLILQLYDQYWEYLTGYTYGTGFRVSVDPFGTMAFPKDSGLSVASGTDVSVGIRLVNITRLGKPWDNCTSSDVYKDLYDHSYTIQLCLDACPEMYIGGHCGCMRPLNYRLYPKYMQSLPPCNMFNDSDKVCVQNSITRILNGSIDCNCEKACQESDYEISTSFSSWPDISYWGQLVRMVCENSMVEDCQNLLDQQDENDTWRQTDALRQNFASLKIYFVDLNYEEITETEAYGTEQFGGELGGALGLWLGISVFTVIEILSYFVQLIIACFKMICRSCHAKK